MEEYDVVVVGAVVSAALFTGVWGLKTLHFLPRFSMPKALWGVWADGQVF